MAARKNRGTKDIPWDETVRHKIKTSMLINRLSSHALGQIELEPTQVKAIEILLRKTMPDLSAVDATMQGELVNYVISAEPMSEDDWEASYGVEPAKGSAKSPH